MVLDDDDDAKDAAVELARIGLDNVAGVMRGVEPWTSSGRVLASYETVSSADLGVAMRADPDLQLVDVRDPLEWAAGHIETSIHAYVPELKLGLPDGLDPMRPVWVACRSGNRASIAGGILERHGLDLIVVSRVEYPTVCERCASSLRRSCTIS